MTGKLVCNCGIIHNFNDLQVVRELEQRIDILSEELKRKTDVINIIGQFIDLTKP